MKIMVSDKRYIDMDKVNKWIPYKDEEGKVSVNTLKYTTTPQIIILHVGNLCEDCNKKRHRSTSIPFYDTSHLLIRDLCPCEKCGGSGYLPQYCHVENGVCFKCGGEGICLDDVLPDLKTVSKMYE